jgi:NADPH:quinone reductase-like Zn-dependent oxidoreductase
MKRIQYDRYGGPDVMHFAEFELPRLEGDEVAVQVKACSVNPIDWKIRQGKLKMLTGRSFPRAMGFDFSGTVLEVGPGATRLKPGDQVFGLARLKQSGGFAEAVVTSESCLAIKPEALSFEQAASLPTAAVTAWNGLVDKAAVRPGQQVFVNGCTGAVGEATVQLARMLGATVSGSCSAGTMDQAKRLGVEPVFDYRKIEFATLVGRFDIVYDTSGAIAPKDGLGLLRPGGRFLDIHASPLKFLRAVFDRRLVLFFCTARPEILDEVAKAAAEGNIHMTVGKTVPFADAIDLIKEIEGGRKLNGKGLIVI